MDKKTYQFIHPQTSEIFDVEGTQVIDMDGYWMVQIKTKTAVKIRTVGIFTKDYSFVVAQNEE